MTIRAYRAPYRRIFGPNLRRRRRHRRRRDSARQGRYHPARFPFGGWFRPPPGPPWPPSPSPPPRPVLAPGLPAFRLLPPGLRGRRRGGSVPRPVHRSPPGLGMGIGGNGGGGGDGGVVTVKTGDGGSTITTTGKHGIAIFAQSVGGGGGLVRTMTTDQTFDPSKIVINP